MAVTNSAHSEASSYRYVIVGVIALATFMNFLVLFNLGVLLPSISDDLNLSPLEQGWLGSSAIIANLVFALPLGWWLSRLDAKLVTTITLVAGGFFIFVQGWAPIFAILLAGRVLFGLAGVAREPARAMLTQQWVPEREIIVMNGLLNGTVGVAIAVGFFLTPFILDWTDDNWRAALYIFGAMTLAVGVLWQILGRQRITESYRQKATSQTTTPLRSLLKYRQLWIIGIGLFGANLLWMAFITFWPTLMLDEYEVSLVTSGVLMAISGIVSSAVGLIIAYMMTRRDVSKWVLLLCGLLITATSAGMCVTGSLPSLLAMSFINGMGWSFFPIAMTLPFQLPGIKPREVAVAIGFLELALWGGGAVGPAFAGILQEATDDLQFTLIIASVFGLLLSAAGLLLPSKRERRIAEVSAGAGSSAPVSNPHEPSTPGGD